MKNVVLIMTDQQRRDSIGALGNPWAKTPNLDALAARGARAYQHFAPNSICSPCRASIFSGLYPRHHGVTRNGVALKPSLELIPHVLKKNGYKTYGVGKFHFQPILADRSEQMPDSWAFWKDEKNHGWDDEFYGFDHADILIGESAVAAVAGKYANWLRLNHPKAVELYKPDNALGERPADFDEVWKCAVPEELHYNNWIANNAIRFIEDTTVDSPFFLFASFPDPHHPFSPPQPWCDLFSPWDVPLPRVDAGELDLMPEYVRRDSSREGFPDDGEAQKVGYLDYIQNPTSPREQGFMMPTRGMSENTLRQVVAHTYGSVSMLDDCIGRVIKALEAKGVLDETIIVFTSDHGELLGDHGLIRKGPTPYQQVLNIPLLISGPGITAGDVKQITNHIDIKATLCDLLDIECAADDGTSFAPLLRQEDASGREATFAEYHSRVDDALYNQSIITPDWRLTIYPNSPGWGELFDRQKDPHEHRNLYGNASFLTIINQLRSQLAEHWPAAPQAGGKAIAVY